MRMQRCAWRRWARYGDDRGAKPIQFRHETDYDAFRDPVAGRWRGQVKRTFLVAAVALPLAACGWFGGKKDDQAATAGPAMSSEEVLKKNCADENWKKQNLGLWYSVCRQPMRW